MASADDKSTITANYNITNVINDANDIRGILSKDLELDKNMWDTNKRILIDSDKVAIMA